MDAGPVPSTRLTRLIYLLRWFQTGAALSVDRIASEFRLCPRTVYRDLRSLRSAGVPVNYDTRHAAYRLDQDNGWVEPLHLSAQELASLSLAIECSPLLGAPRYADLLQDCQQRMVQLLGSADRGRIHRALEACHLPQRAQMCRGGEWIWLFLEAIQSRRKLWVELEPSQPAPRHLRFAPHRLELRATGCHAIGRAERLAIDTLALRHIEYAESTTRRFSVPRRR